MENKIFTIDLTKEFKSNKYIAGFDPYDDSISMAIVLMTKPKQQYGIKKIKGFNRAVNIGWSYIIEKI